jgi:hypothetical protein
MDGSVICFLDNDVLLKLSAFGLLDEAIVALLLKPENLYVLSTAQHVFRKNRKVSAKYNESIRDRAIEFVKTCNGVIPEESTEFTVLERFLDVGEATLIAATRREVSSFVLMTGDKRCLQVLAARSEISEAYGRLQGRVICLEQVLLLLIRRSGFDWVKVRVVPMRDCDAALQACFGSGGLAIEENVILALEGYIEALRRYAPGLLADLSGF